MAQHDRLYQRAVYYDIALRRDVTRETAFVRDVFQSFVGRPLTSMLDIACGPGYHARSMAASGVRTTGIDLSDSMIALARDRSSGEGLPLEWMVADMRSFSLPEPVDMAICMFDGIDALTETNDFILHLRTLSKNLEQDGLYLIDCTHPRDCNYGAYGEYRYSGQRDGISVDILWSTNTPRIDPVSGVAEVEIEMHVDDNGEPLTIRDRARERCFTAQELTLLVRLSGVFEVVAWFGDVDLGQPLDSSLRSRRMIALLQNKMSEHT